MLHAAFLIASLVSPLDDCRAQRDAFDVDATIASCAAAADDTRLDVASRIFALRLLAGAHLLKKDERAAELILVRMLAFDADAAPAADDGPEFRRVLERARARVLDAGALHARWIRDGERAISVRVDDRYGRVARAEMVDGDARTPLPRLDETPGVSSFALPADVPEHARIVLSAAGPTRCWSMDALAASALRLRRPRPPRCPSMAATPSAGSSSAPAARSP